MPNSPTPRRSKRERLGIAVGIAAAGWLWLIDIQGLFSWLAGPEKAGELMPPHSEERRTIDYCKMIRHTIQFDDKVCRKYLAVVDAELAQEKKNAAVTAARRRAEEQAVANPDRKITRIELAACQSALQDSLKNPGNFIVHSETIEGGGRIDYSAADEFGVPIRKTMQCTTGRNVEDR